MCNVTHSLLVVGKDVMRLPFTKCAMSLTTCLSWETGLPSTKCAMSLTNCCIVGQYIMRLPFTKCAMSLTHCDMKRCDESAFCKMCNVTDLLLVIVGEERCDETPFHKMCSVTDMLLRWMRLPIRAITKCALPLTCYWS